MKRNLILVILSLILIISFSNAVFADDNITVQIEGKTISFDVSPQILNGRTLVPLRAIFENLGASVDWNNDTQTVTSIKGNTRIQLTINDNIMYVNDEAKTLDVAASLVDGRTLVPLRAISEAFGCQVDWVEELKLINIYWINDNNVAYTSETNYFAQIADYKREVYAVDYLANIQEDSGIYYNLLGVTQSGSAKPLPFGLKERNSVYKFCFYNDNLYYLVLDNERYIGRIYCSDLSGENNYLLADNVETESNICIINNRLYYEGAYHFQKNKNQGGIYSIDLRDLSWKKLDDCGGLLKYCDGNHVYIINRESGTGYAISCDGNEKISVASGCDELNCDYIKGTEVYKLDSLLHDGLTDSIITNGEGNINWNWANYVNVIYRRTKNDLTHQRILTLQTNPVYIENVTEDFVYITYYETDSLARIYQKEREIQDNYLSGGTYWDAVNNYYEQYYGTVTENYSRSSNFLLPQ